MLAQCFLPNNFFLPLSFLGFPVDLLAASELVVVSGLALCLSSRPGEEEREVEGEGEGDGEGEAEEVWLEEGGGVGRRDELDACEADGRIRGTGEGPGGGASIVTVGGSLPNEKT